MNTQEIITALDVIQNNVDKLRNEVLNKSETLTEVKPKYINEKYTYNEIYNICHNHEAAVYFNVGDQLKVKNTHDDKKSIIFDVVDVKDNSITLVTHYLVAQIPFGAQEPGNPDEYISEYGSNNYEQSAVRQWINSAEASGNWWKPQTEYDAPIANLNYMDGFLYGIDKGFVDVVFENELGDKFWLLSEDEVNNTPFFKNKENRKKQYVSGEKDYWWLRSPHSGSTDFVHCVDTSGGLNGDIAYNACGVAPACAIIG